MSKFKTALIAGGLAFVVNNLCVILLMSGGVFFGPLAYIGDWLLYPVLHFWMQFAPSLKSDYFSVIVLYVLGLLQFFIVFWVIIKTVFWFKKKRPPVI